MFGKPKKNKNLKDFLNKSTIHGLRLLSYYTPFKYARYEYRPFLLFLFQFPFNFNFNIYLLSAYRPLWIVFIFAIIVWTHFIIITLIIRYVEQPTEVRMSTNVIHISNTPFPSAAICSANRFSRTKLQKFAEEM